MRTIKFRGFDLLGNKQIGLLETDGIAYFINDEIVDDYYIGQFTGLYDVKEGEIGTEIYEGDIVRLKSTIGKRDNFNDYEIKWSDEECSFVLYDDESENYGSKNLSKKLIKDKELKVVGNIYENNSYGKKF